MHHDLALDAVDDVPLAPGKIVVVLDVEQNLETQMPRDVAVDQVVVCSRIASHQLHCRPVFLSVGVGEVEPSHVQQFP